MPSRYSRHYYDLYRLALSPVRAEAFSDKTLLPDVVAFKQRFYPSNWAHYELARPGSLRLIPQDTHLKELEQDYRAMGVMIFNALPAFQEVIDQLKALEDEINRLG